MAAKKKVDGGSWQVLVEHLESQNRLMAEAHEVTRREVRASGEALDRKFTTRMDDLERALAATRAEGAETRRDLAALRDETRGEFRTLRDETRSEFGTLRGELVTTRDQLVERFDATRVELVERIDSLDQRMDSLEQRIERMDRPGSVH
jgi:chromosome segregation ATPase